MSIPAAIQVVHAATQGASNQDPSFTQTVGWSKGSIGIWVGIAMALIYGLPKFIAQLKKLSNDRGDQLDEERRDDMSAMRKEIADIKQEAKSARERAGYAEDHARDADARARESDLRLSTAMIVIRMLTAKVEAEWPDDPLLKNIGTLLDAAMPQQELLMRGLTKVARQTGKDGE